MKVVCRGDFNEAQPFDREFRGIQKFEPVSRGHDGLVDILQIGRNEEEGYFYYVMELADALDAGYSMPNAGSTNIAKGAPHPESSIRHPASYSPHTLRTDLAHGRLPAARTLEIGLALTDALAHLHAAGLVHRDIKPSNIIFVGGKPKLADIGLVPDASDQCSIVGTEGYLAPEGPGTGQADLFALGKVLYEMSMGRSRLDFPALPADWDELPVEEQNRLAELNAVIVKACEVDVTRRYQCTVDLRRDLERLQLGRSIRHQRVWEQTLRLSRRLVPIAALVVAAVWFAVSRSNDSNTQRLSASPPTTSVFVLPFRNEGTNGNDGGLAGRVSDAFINSLRLINGVTVAQRRSALAERPVAEARADAARLFGVRYVLTGRLKEGDAATLSLDLHEAGRELPVWSQNFIEMTNRWIELEEQAIRALAAALNTPITPDTARRISQTLTNNIAALKLVEHGVKAFFIETRAGFEAALQRYNEALDLDPDYLEAWSRKAQLYRELVVDDHPRRVWPEIKACAERMLQIDPTSEAGQYFRWVTQFIYEWDWNGGEATFRERRARDADGPVVTALYLRMLGRFEEARVEQAKVAQLNQRDAYVRNHTAAAVFVERDYRRVIEEADKTEAFLARPGIAGEWRFHAHYQLGEFEQALEAIRAVRKLRDAPARMALEACGLAKLGKKEAALKILGDLEKMPGIGRYVDPYPLAWVHLALGDKPAALAKLRQACQDRSEWVVFTDEPGGLRTDPKLDELRDEPAFQELLKLAGLDVWPK